MKNTGMIKEKVDDNQKSFNEIDVIVYINNFNNFYKTLRKSTS